MKVWSYWDHGKPFGNFLFFKIKIKTPPTPPTPDAQKETQT